MIGLKLVVESGLKLLSALSNPMSKNEKGIISLIKKETILEVRRDGVTEGLCHLADPYWYAYLVICELDNIVPIQHRFTDKNNNFYVALEKASSESGIIPFNLGERTNLIVAAKGRTSAHLNFAISVINFRTGTLTYRVVNKAAANKLTYLPEMGSLVGKVMEGKQGHPEFKTHEQYFSHLLNKWSREAAENLITS